MNSYSDSGYQDASSGFLSGQNMSKAELRMQHSYPGAVVRSARAEGQAAAQVQPVLCVLLLWWWWTRVSGRPFSICFGTFRVFECLKCFEPIYLATSSVVLTTMILALLPTVGTGGEERGRGWV